MTTEEDMRGIASQIVGTYLDLDGGFGNQCWDSAMWINEKFFGLPRINTGGAGRWPGWAGNMVDAFPQSPEIDAAYELLPPSAPGLPGDTYVWGDSNPTWYPKTHVATLVVDTGNGWPLFLSQNSSMARPDLPGYSEDSTGPVIYQNLPIAGLIGIIRPRTSGSLGYMGDIITPVQEDEMSDAQVERIINEVNAANEAKHVATREKIDDAVKSVNWNTQQQVEAVGRVTQQLIIDNAKPDVLVEQIVAAGIAKDVADLLAKRLAA